MDPDSPLPPTPSSSSQTQDRAVASGLAESARTMWQYSQTVQSKESILAAGCTKYQPLPDDQTEEQKEKGVESAPNSAAHIDSLPETLAKKLEILQTVSSYDKSGVTSEDAVTTLHQMQTSQPVSNDYANVKEKEEEEEEEEGEEEEGVRGKGRESLHSQESSLKKEDEDDNVLIKDDVLEGQTSVSTTIPASVPSPSPPYPPSPSPSSSLFHTPATSPFPSPPLSRSHTPSPPLTPSQRDLDSHLLLSPNVIHVTTTDAESQTLEVSLSDSYCQTQTTESSDMGMNTEEPALREVGVATERVEKEEAECNTDLRISPGLLERAALDERLAQMQSEHAAGLVELNEAKSQRMVAEELARIVQSELAELRQRNVAETTTRMRLENTIGEMKVELSSAQHVLEEKDQRVMELEETLTGTSLLVRKLEEQNAATLMNRGGIDYMLQAKLADARAQEAEQKLEMAQVELLQAQGEVKRLLDRVGETTRDRSEMVSHKVHSQLLQIADERALAAEQKARQLERELLNIRQHLRGSDHDLGQPLPGTLTQPLSGLSSYSPSPGYSSTLGGYSSLSSLPPLSSMYAPSSSSLLTPQQPSLEPFKLSFSLPSAQPTSSLSSSRPYSMSSDRPQPEVTSDSLLKPSSLLEEEAKTHKHVSWGTSSSSPPISSTSSKPHESGGTTDTSFPPSHISGEPVSGHTQESSLELPTFDPTLPEPHPPLSDQTKQRQGEGGSGSSSDWSSSDEEDTTNPLKPSMTTSLTAQWEWRTMQEGGTEIPHTTIPTGHTATPTGHTPKKKPPPTAPKPKFSHTHPYDYHWQETPSSFVEPTRVSGLHPLSSSFRRPRGPRGRKLPSRFSKHREEL